MSHDTSTHLLVLHMRALALHELAGANRKTQRSSHNMQARWLEMRALPAPEPTRRITAHPHSAPLHRIRTDDMLPLQLLTPHQVRLSKIVNAAVFVGTQSICCTSILLQVCWSTARHDQMHKLV